MEFKKNNNPSHLFEMKYISAKYPIGVFFPAAAKKTYFGLW